MPLQQERCTLPLSEQQQHTGWQNFGAAAVKRAPLLGLVSVLRLLLIITYKMHDGIKWDRVRHLRHVLAVKYPVCFVALSLPSQLSFDEFGFK